jgi:hypothetical protein
VDFLGVTPQTSPLRVQTRVGCLATASNNHQANNSFAQTQQVIFFLLMFANKNGYPFSAIL